MSDLPEFKEEEFNNLLKSKKSGLVLFGAPWCAACKLVKPILKNLMANFPKVSFAEIDVAKSPGLASRLKVMSLPNLLFINDGKIFDQIIGVTGRQDIEEKLKNI